MARNCRRRRRIYRQQERMAKTPQVVKFVLFIGPPAAASRVNIGRKNVEIMR